MDLQGSLRLIELGYNPLLLKSLTKDQTVESLQSMSDGDSSDIILFEGSSFVLHTAPYDGKDRRRITVVEEDIPDFFLKGTIQGLEGASLAGGSPQVEVYSPDEIVFRDNNLFVRSHDDYEGSRTLHTSLELGTDNSETLLFHKLSLEEKLLAFSTLLADDLKGTLNLSTPGHAEFTAGGYHINLSLNSGVNVAVKFKKTIPSGSLKYFASSVNASNISQNGRKVNIDRVREGKQISFTIPLSEAYKLVENLNSV